MECALRAAARSLRVSRHRLHARDAAREGLSRERGPLPQDRLLAGARFASLTELDEAFAGWRDRIALPRRHATGRHVVAERLAHEREQLRSLPPIAFDAAGRRTTRVPFDGYLKHAASFYRAPETLVHQRVELRWDRDRVWIEHRGARVADYQRSYAAGTWQPAPRLRPEPPALAPLIPIAGPEIVPPALSDYAELCA